MVFNPSWSKQSNLNSNTIDYSSIKYHLLSVLMIKRVVEDWMFAGLLSNNCISNRTERHLVAVPDSCATPPGTKDLALTVAIFHSQGDVV